MLRRTYKPCCQHFSVTTPFVNHLALLYSYLIHVWPTWDQFVIHLWLTCDQLVTHLWPYCYSNFFSEFTHPYPCYNQTIPGIWKISVIFDQWEEWGPSSSHAIHMWCSTNWSHKLLFHVKGWRLSHMVHRWVILSCVILSIFSPNLRIWSHK